MKNLKEILPGIIFTMLCLLSIIGFIWSGIDLRNSRIEFNKNIGKSITIRQDTLMIIDGSYFGGNYTIDNGIEIRERLVKSLIINPD